MEDKCIICGKPCVNKVCEGCFSEWLEEQEQEDMDDYEEVEDLEELENPYYFKKGVKK